MNSDRIALKAGMWYTISNVLAKGITILTTGVFTRLLTKQEYGLYNNYASCLLIATVIVTLNLDASLISARFDYKDRLDEYLYSILGLGGTSVFFWALLINCFHGFFSSILGINWCLINIMLLYLFFSQAILLFQERARLQFEYQTNIILNLIVTIGGMATSVLLVCLLQDKLLGLIVGSVLPTMVVGAALYGVFFRKGRRIRIEYWKYALPICLPYIPHLLSMSILHAIDKIMITRYCGAEANAIYSLAYICGSVISLFGMSINNAFSPWLGNKLEENTPESLNEIKSFSQKYIGVFFCASVGIMTVAPEILVILGGSKYIESKYAIVPIAAGCLYQFLYTMFVNIEQYKKKTIGMAFASATAALVNLILNYLFIPKYSYLAAAYTTMVSYMCLLFIHMYIVKQIDMDFVYSYSYVVRVCVLGILLTVLMIFLYQFDKFRYFFLVVYIFFIAIIIWKNRIEVCKVIKSFIL